MQPECTNRKSQLQPSFQGKASASHFSAGVACHAPSANVPHDHLPVACAPACDAQFRRDVIAGLSRPRKELHCKYFYDERGSQLFDQICELDEYYPTRIETQIMESYAEAMASHIGPRAVVLEYGSGSSTKTRILLDNLQSPRAYLPVDISQDYLLKTAERLRADYRTLHVQPIVADFTESFEFPSRFACHPTTVYFPGSTIGNLEQRAAFQMDQTAILQRWTVTINRRPRHCGRT